MFTTDYILSHLKMVMHQSAILPLSVLGRRVAIITETKKGGFGFKRCKADLSGYLSEWCIRRDSIIIPPRSGKFRELSPAVAWYEEVEDVSKIRIPLIFLYTVCKHSASINNDPTYCKNREDVRKRGEGGRTIPRMHKIKATRCELTQLSMQIQNHKLCIRWHKSRLYRT